MIRSPLQSMWDLTIHPPVPRVVVGTPPISNSDTIGLADIVCVLAGTSHGVWL